MSCISCSIATFSMSMLVTSFFISLRCFCTDFYVLSTYWPTCMSFKSKSSACAVFSTSFIALSSAKVFLGIGLQRFTACFAYSLSTYFLVLKAGLTFLIPTYVGTLGANFEPLISEVLTSRANALGSMLALSYATLSFVTTNLSFSCSFFYFSASYFSLNFSRLSRPF